MSEINFRFVRQSALRDFEFFQRCIVIVVAVIIRKSASQVRFGQIGLQLQSPLGQGLELFRDVPASVRKGAGSSFPTASSAQWREQSLDPARWRAGKAARFVSVFRSPRRRTGKIVRLDKSKIGLAVLRGLTFHLRFFVWR